MEKLIGFLNGSIVDNGAVIEPDTELVMEGIIDSMNVVTLLSYLESRTGKVIEIGELDISHIETPRMIAETFLQGDDECVTT